MCFAFTFCQCFNLWYTCYQTHTPNAGSRVERINQFHFLAGCHKGRLNQALSVLSSHRFNEYVFWRLLRLLFVLTLVCVCMCSIVWLFWLSCQFMSSDWLERLLWGSLFILHKPQAEERLSLFQFSVLIHCFIVHLSCPRPYTIYFTLILIDIACLCWMCHKTWINQPHRHPPPPHTVLVYVPVHCSTTAVQLLSYMHQHI